MKIGYNKRTNLRNNDRTHDRQEGNRENLTVEKTIALE